MSEEWCREQLDNLQIIDRRLYTLNEIRNHLTKLPATDLASVSSKFLTPSDLFDCIVDNQERNNEQSNLACDILSFCMSNLDLEEPTKTWFYLERSLEHVNDGVKLLGLNEVHRISKHVPIQIFSQSIVVAVLKCVESSHEEIACLAVTILPKILPRLLTDQSIHSSLNKLLLCPDLIRCRTYDISISIAKESKDNLEQLSYVIDRLCMDLQSNDILLELNILEFLSELAQVNYGWSYLENKGIFHKITENVDNLANHPLKNILFPGYMKFFGNIASKQPVKIIQGFPLVMNTLLNLLLVSMVSDIDGTILPVVFDTLAQLGSTDQGKILLEDLYTEKINQIFNEIRKCIRNFPTRLQIRALNCLEILFQCCTLNNRVNSITRDWFNSLTGKSGMVFILDFCRNPFPDIKIAALAFLKSIVTSNWCQKKLEETAGFVEFLLDRNIEFSKDAIHEKYGVIKILSTSTVFDSATLVELKRYVQQGAFYVEGVMDVVAEGRG